MRVMNVSIQKDYKIAVFFFHSWWRILEQPITLQISMKLWHYLRWEMTGRCSCLEPKWLRMAQRYPPPCKMPKTWLHTWLQICSDKTQTSLFSSWSKCIYWATSQDPVSHLFQCPILLSLEWQGVLGNHLIQVLYFISGVPKSGNGEPLAHS